jgi:phage head maturation protease
MAAVSACFVATSAWPAFPCSMAAFRCAREENGGEENGVRSHSPSNTRSLYHTLSAVSVVELPALLELNLSNQVLRKVRK